MGQAALMATLVLTGIIFPGDCLWSAAPDGVIQVSGPWNCEATITWPTAGTKTVCLAKKYGDPNYGQWYQTHCEQITVQVQPSIFADGLESGDTSAWSSTH